MLEKLSDTLQFNADSCVLRRYPTTSDKSLRAWSSADLLVLDYCKEREAKSVHLYNDRFGIWNCFLHSKNPITVYTYASQQKAVLKNLKANNLTNNTVFKTPLDDLRKVDLVLMKIPKSLELFELFLQQIHNSSSDGTEVVCGFMLKYFSPSFLKIAALYFDTLTQTKAWKKARLLILKNPKKDVSEKELVNTILWNNKILRQYYGVFSSGGIDIGTRFFLENLKVLPEEKKVLDLASGNGVIAHEVTQLNKETTVTLVDDFNLAIASSKLNLSNEKARFICVENLNSLEGENFDLVVSNPPFHFEHENNIEVSLLLFNGVKNCLKSNGRFLLVANAHLNYKTHLAKLFTSVLVLNTNKKFVVYECAK